MDFLRELWEEKSKEERGEEGEKFPDIFVWNEDIKKDESLKNLFNPLCEQIKRYAATIETRKAALAYFDKEGRNEDTLEELVSTDRAQRSAHNALISALTAFIRNCVKKGIRIDIDLESIKNSRDFTRDWVMKNVDAARKIFAAEEKK